MKMDFIDNVLIKLKRNYKRDEVIQALYSKIESLEKENEYLKRKPPTKAQIWETKGGKAINFIKDVFAQGKRKDHFYTFKVPEEYVKQINRELFST